MIWRSQRRALDCWGTASLLTATYCKIRVKLNGAALVPVTRAASGVATTIPTIQGV
jgi:hypothetical protein